MPLQRLNTAKGIIAKYQGKAYHHTLMQRTDADAYVNARGADGNGGRLNRKLLSTKEVPM